MRLVFGTPQMTGFLVWGFRMPLAVGSSRCCALLDKDWNPTPAGKVFEQLMTDWQTDLTSTANADGKINFTGFYGDYDLTAGGHHYSLTLTKGTKDYSIAPDENAYSLVLYAGRGRGRRVHFFNEHRTTRCRALTPTLSRSTGRGSRTRGPRASWPSLLPALAGSRMPKQRMSPAAAWR